MNLESKTILESSSETFDWKECNAGGKNVVGVDDLKLPSLGGRYWGKVKMSFLTIIKPL